MPGHRFSRHAAMSCGCALHLRRRLRDGMRDEARDIDAPLSKRRDRDPRSGDPIVEVRPEAAGGDGGAQIAVRGEAVAHVHLPGRRGAEWHDLTRLERAQELRLDAEIEASPISSRKRTPRSAACRVPDGIGVGARVCATLCAEQGSRSCEPWWNRRAVHGNEGAGAMRTGPVVGPRGEAPSRRRSRQVSRAASPTLAHPARSPRGFSGRAGRPPRRWTRFEAHRQRIEDEEGRVRPTRTTAGAWNLTAGDGHAAEERPVFGFGDHGGSSRPSRE